MLTGYGYQLENLVYLELRHREFEIYCGTLRNKEVDFVVTKGDKTEYYQVSFSLFDETTREREFASLLSIKDNFPKFIITLDDFVGREVSGIRIKKVYKPF
jgi:hypothetical protein